MWKHGSTNKVPIMNNTVIRSFLSGSIRKPCICRETFSRSHRRYTTNTYQRNRQYKKSQICDVIRDKHRKLQLETPGWTRSPWAFEVIAHVATAVKNGRQNGVDEPDGNKDSHCRISDVDPFTPEDASIEGKDREFDSRIGKHPQHHDSSDYLE